MKYLVTKTFTDKETLDGYNEGDIYESNDSERVAFLQEEGFLKSDPDEEGIKHVGGGYYELPDGEKIKGKEAALEALKEVEQKGE